MISSVIPQNTTATELVLYRHFTAAEGELDVAIASDHPALATPSDGVPIPPHPLLLRLTKTRFAAIAHSLRQLLPTHDTRSLLNYLTHYRPDAILTVAHGTLYPVALRMARQFQLPLISIFHDWFPDMAWVPDIVRPFLAHQFRRLYQCSDLAFCVSEGMKKALGNHQNAWVLPPIPENQKQSMVGDRIASAKSNHAASSDTDYSIEPPFTIVYAGNLSECYAPMMQQLGQHAKTLSSVRLRFFGPVPNWTPAYIQDLSEAGIYGGFLSRDALTKELKNADALLVVMSFSLGDRRRMETSFPSKLIEYCAFGKPLIIWGPDYCTAIQWARETKGAIAITTANPAIVLQTFQTLSQSQQHQKMLVQHMQISQEKSFQPGAIQNQFFRQIHTIVSSQNFSKPQQK